jgi:hypothetical protein
MTPEHLWIQKRVVKICAALGYMALLEDNASHSDVLVLTDDEKPILSIEIQRWSTDFEKRTASRLSLGLQVLWLITENAKSHSSTSRALFHQPAVRLLVQNKVGQSRKPWDKPEDARDALLFSMATVAHLEDDGMLRTHKTSLKTLLREILSSQRHWCNAQTSRLLGLGYACWVLDEDRRVIEEISRKRNCQEIANTENVLPLRKLDSVPREPISANQSTATIQEDNMIDKKNSHLNPSEISATQISQDIPSDRTTEYIESREERLPVYSMHVEETNTHQSWFSRVWETIFHRQRNHR